MPRPLHYASVCSGIEAAHLALTPHGFAAHWFSDTDPFASALLAHHYPDIPNHGDMRTLAPRIRSGDIPAPDLLCAGPPCQSFSTIGQRARILTPLECERLQGFPDHYTRIPYRGKPADQCPDTPRYKAIGNAWSVPVIAWLGQRLAHAMRTP